MGSFAASQPAVAGGLSASGIPSPTLLIIVISLVVMAIALTAWMFHTLAQRTGLPAADRAPVDEPAYWTAALVYQ